MKTIKDTILYKKVNSGRMNLKAKNKTQISIKSKIPVCNIQLAEELIEHDLLLEPSTSYSISFYCDKEGKLEISLGGSNPVQHTTVIGFNQLTVETSVYLANKNFIVKGRDIKISKVKIIKTNETITDYFEGLLSVHDYKSKDIPYVVKVRTHNEDSLKEDVVDVIIQEPLRSINELRDRIIKVDNEWVVERNCIEINLKNNIWYNINYDEGHDLFITQLDYIPPSEPLVFYDFTCDKYSTDIQTFGVNFCYLFELEGFYYFAVLVDASVSMSSFDKNVTLVLPLKEKRYEKLSNKLEAYTYHGITHIENNSLVPCKMNIKNHGFDIRNLSPGTNYTAIYNSSDSLTINVNGKEFELNKDDNKATIVSSPNLTDNDILFYGKGVKLSDFSLLEGIKTEVPKDYVKKLESSYESERIDNEPNIYHNKYKVYIETNQRSKVLYIDEPLRKGDMIYTDNVETNTTILKKVTGQLRIDDNVPSISNWAEYNTNHADYIGFCLNGLVFENATTTKSLLMNEYFPSYTLIAPDQIKGEHIIKVADKVYLSIKKARLESADAEGLKIWLKENPFDIVYQLDTPIFITLDESKMQLQMGSNTKVSTISNVPVESISFNYTQELGLQLRQSTQYRITFRSNSNGIINYFYCSGAELENVEVKLGYNTFLINTPDAITNNMMIINGQGFNIFEFMITEGDMEFISYFEDVSYLGELTEDNQYLIRVNDKEYFFDEPLRSSSDKEHIDVLRYDYNTDKVIIERKVDKDLNKQGTQIEETNLTHDDMCLTTNDGETNISFVANLPIKAHVSNRGYRINTLDSIETYTIVIDGEGDITAKIEDKIGSSVDNRINFIAPANMPEKKLYLFGQGAYTNSVMAIKGKNINTNGYFAGKLSCFQDRKITDSANKNYGKYEVKFVVTGEEYLYIKTLYIDIPLSSGDYLERKTDGIYHVVRRPGMTVSTKISDTDFVLDIFKNSELEAMTLIPLSVLTTTNYEEEILDLKPNTQYILKFVSDKDGDLHYIDLGGNKIEAIDVHKGRNTLMITTPKTLSHYSLVFDGLGLNIKEVLLTEHQDTVIVDDIHYFEGTSSSYESEYNDILRKYNAVVTLNSKNLFNGNLAIINLGGTIYYYTDYISIDGYKKYISNIIEDDIYMGQIFLYDKNKNQLYTEMIDTLVKTNYESYPINANIRYMQIRYLNRYENIQIEEGTVPTEYVEYHNGSVEIGLSTPLKKGDELIYKDGDMYHYHGDTNSYEKVYNGIIQLASSDIATFNTFSAVPIDTVTTTRYQESGLDFLPDKSYVLSFESDKDGVLNFINFGGVILNNVIVVKGINRRIITMPESTNDKLIIDGQGITISKMVITEHISDEITKDIGFFEGTKSSFEDKIVTIKSISGDKLKEDTITFNLSAPLQNGEVIEFRPYGIFHIHIDGYEEELQVDKTILEIFNNCTIKTLSEVPIKRITSKEYEQRITKLKPSKIYTVKFDASNSGILDLSLGGTAKQVTAIKGTNVIEIKTPTFVSDDTLRVAAKNMILSDVLIMERETVDISKVKYFKTVQSVFESNTKEIDGETKYVLRIVIGNYAYEAYLTTPLLDNDSIIWDGENLKHYHNTYIDTNMFAIAPLEEPYYEIISTDAPLFNIPANTTIKVDSNIPIRDFTTIDGFEENNLHIEPGKEYFIMFDSDKDGRLDKIMLGGNGLRGIKIVEGKNCIMIRTPDPLENHLLKLNGTGIQIRNILIIENTGGQLKQSVPYFKGIRHTFDNEQNEAGYKAEVIVVSYDKNDTYHIDKKELTLSTPLIENDRITVLNESLYHIHNSKSITLSGYELWRKEGLSNSRYVVFSFRIPDMKGDLLIADRFLVEDISADVNCERLWFKNSRIYVSIAAENIEMNNITMYLEKRPITIVYDLIEPVYELLDDSELSLYMEEKANLYIKTFIPCKSLSFSYDTGLINLSELSQASYIISNTSLDVLAQTWETDYKLSEMEWALQNQNILLTNLRSSSMLVISRYIQAKRLIENEVYDRERMTKQLDRYYEKKELTREEYEELIEMIN